MTTTAAPAGVTVTAGAARPTRRLAALAAVVALVAAGCSGGSAGGAAPNATSTTTATAAPATSSTSPAADPAAAEVVPTGSYPVGTTEIALVDTSRGTPANNGAPATDERRLPTVVFYPAVGEPGSDPAVPEVIDDAEARDDRYPLIVFSHGVTAKGVFYRAELAAWASAGYVAVAADYPLSNQDSPGGPTITDVGNQPADASFLIDEFTDPDGDTPAAEVADQVDPGHIGAVGHSLGAVTSLGLGYGTCCADDRVTAVASWAGMIFPMLGEASPAPGITDRPLLLIHGDADGTVPYQSSVSAFDEVESPRWFITLPGAEHIPPFISPDSSEVSSLVTSATLAFFDAELKGDTDGITRLETAVEAVGRASATLQSAGS